MGGSAHVTAGTGIRVRMYRVGFGDFFLVTIPSSDGPQHILIDCGVFKGTSQTGDIGSIEAAVEHMAEATGKRLALLIMTHRHADHIAGFARCDAVFKQCKVEAVWMPAWEAEYKDNPKFQATLTRIAERLRNHLALAVAAAPDDAELGALFHMMGNATGIEPIDVLAAGGAGAGAAKPPKHGSNAAALALLKTGLVNAAGGKVTPEYYVRGDTLKVPQALVDAGVTARVLGPPPIDEFDLLKLMDLEKGVGEYLALANAAGAGRRGAGFAPFAPSWEDKHGASYTEDAFREWKLARKDGAKPDARDPRLAAQRRLEAALVAVQPATLAYAAKTLDDYLNNQSLVLLFTVLGKTLLFVGDAQAGNWEHWLYDTDQADPDPAGPITAEAKTILGKLDFYKVGHHGSTNATPIMVADALRADVVAMCSTEKDVYGSEDNDSEVPRLPLLQAMRDHGAALVRSDQIDVDYAGIEVDAQVPAPLPKPAHGRLTQGPIFIDYEL